MSHFPNYRPPIHRFPVPPGPDTVTGTSGEGQAAQQRFQSPVRPRQGYEGNGMGGPPPMPPPFAPPTFMPGMPAGLPPPPFPPPFMAPPGVPVPGWMPGHQGHVPPGPPPPVVVRPTAPRPNITANSPDTVEDDQANVKSTGKFDGNDALPSNFQQRLKTMLQELGRLHKVPEESEEDMQVKAGRQWVTDFATKRTAASVCPSNTPSMNLNEYRRMLKDAAVLHGKLKDIFKDLQQEGIEDSEWNEKILSVKTLKESLHQLKEVLCNKEVVGNMKKKLNRIAKKRDRIRRAKERRKIEEDEKEAARQKRHEEIDNWQRGLLEMEQQLKREKEMKKVADQTLGEVRRKLSEAKRSLEVLQSLKKLRQIRSDAMNKKGLYTPIDVNKAFDERMKIMTDMLEERINLYETEKKTLEVMLESVQVESEEKERQEEETRQREKYTHRLALTQQYLFGREDPVDADSPMFAFRQYYNGGQQSVDNLIRIRHDWDVYLAADHVEGASCLPTGFVQPSPPSSDTWASALTGT